ncbi:YchJ family metal-binding protein [Streptomyces sp. NPDC046887]|uniref:YchJ family protein n=1 Tax=Streptomyces sp. NPDC046887 TaxID=3155472 RepID=UPI003406805C
MARRTARRRPAPSTVATPAAPPGPQAPCPCGLPAAYGDCCRPLHSGEAAAPTAERLMRSRYSAFAVGDAGYLLRTWAPATRPATLELDPAMRWTGLEITGTTDGTLFHSTGTVTFTARYTHHGQPGALSEHSRFEKADGRWVYLDGTFPDDASGG